MQLDGFWFMILQKLMILVPLVVLWLYSERDYRQLREKLNGDPAERALKRAEERSKARASGAAGANTSPLA